MERTEQAGNSAYRKSVAHDQARTRGFLRLFPSFCATYFAVLYSAAPTSSDTDESEGCVGTHQKQGVGDLAWWRNRQNKWRNHKIQSLLLPLNPLITKGSNLSTLPRTNPKKKSRVNLCLPVNAADAASTNAIPHALRAETPPSLFLRLFIFARTRSTATCTIYSFVV